MKLPAHLGMNLLGIWLALFGLLPLLTAGTLVLNFSTLLSLLAVAAGILLLLGR